MTCPQASSPGPQSLALVCVAAGQSRRLPGERPKIFRPLGGKPIYEQALDRFAHRSDLSEVVLVGNPETLEILEERWAGVELPWTLRLVAGGTERALSVWNGLRAVSETCELVLIHDAARPLTSRAVIDSTIAAALAHGAAIPVLPVRDTVKRGFSSERFAPNWVPVQETVPREGLWLAQTPQVFRRVLIVDAYRRGLDAGATFTDDAQVMEAAGHLVMMTPGSAYNMKVTYPEDLELAERLLPLLLNEGRSSGSGPYQAVVGPP